MTIINSVLFGKNQNYNICNIQVNFTNQSNSINVFDNNLFGNSVKFFINDNAIFPTLTLGYLHVFIHEMGHALALKLNGSRNITVNIYTNCCQGSTLGGNTNRFSYLAGPLAGISLETIKLIGAVACTTFSHPIIISSGIFLGVGSVVWLFGEMMYALIGHGDWDFIRG